MSSSSVDEDLIRSGLIKSDMEVRELDGPERTTCAIPPGLNGYVIPYYSILGALLPFYRCRVFESVPKYKQPSR